MNRQRNINPLPLYHTRTIRFDDITTQMAEQETEVKNLFWIPNEPLLHRIRQKLDREQIRDRILDVACGATPFDRATHLVDFDNRVLPGRHVFKVDLDYDRFAYEDRYFDFVYSRHTLEDIQNPLHAFQEITRIGKQGYIETPSPLIECMRDVDANSLSPSYRGYIHHRYIVWTDVRNHTLYFLPKYPIIDHITFHESYMKKLRYLANYYPVYWNNYYTWDPQHPPKIVVYRNGMNFSLVGDEYGRLINESIRASMEATNQFLAGL
jgi:hypothetical protein